MTSQELASVLRAFTRETEVSKSLFEFLEAMAALQADTQRAISALTAENSAGDSRSKIKALRAQLKASENSINAFSRKPVLLAIKDLVHRVTALPSPQFDPLSSKFFDHLERFMKGYLAFNRGGGATATADVLASGAALHDWLTSWMLSANSLVETLALPEVSKYPQFSFIRTRGIVWVCDLVDSSKGLNDDASVADLEVFLPRLHWVATQLVSVAGAQFVKWTGDGFLAWHPAELQRDVGSIAAKLVEAAEVLTFLVNGTSLGVGDELRFRVRHGITLEQDALLTTINVGGVRSFDIMGRDVVLAFRLSGMDAQPEKPIGSELVKGLNRVLRLLETSILTNIPISLNRQGYRRRKVNATECLKYFKGEKLGTDPLWYYTASAGGKSRSISSTLKTMDETKSQGSLVDYQEFFEALQNGIDWGPEVLRRHDRLAAAAVRSAGIGYKGLKEIAQTVSGRAQPRKSHRAEKKS